MLRWCESDVVFKLLSAFLPTRVLLRMKSRGVINLGRGATARCFPPAEHLPPGQPDPGRLPALRTAERVLRSHVVDPLLSVLLPPRELAVVWEI